MENGEELLQCYNRGCGQKYTESSNKDDSCCHHPGAPFFHDVYKGWSCCNKKCIDFTEFLNVKGCTKSKHSNIKPPEPEKPPKSSPGDDEIIEVKPIARSTKKRPPFETPLTKMKPELAPSLRDQVLETTAIRSSNSEEIEIGTICKNGGCNSSYEGPLSNETPCTHHPGVPIFHEGMKFWSCCQKRTSDFSAFLSQIGCQQGEHVWKKEKSDESTVNCRWDFHQTASHVVVSIYAKQFCAKTSTIELNPIRIRVVLVFPEQAGATFKLDYELQGIIDVERSEVNMYSTKVEIKMRKAEPGSWPRLEIPRKIGEEKSKQSVPVGVAEITPQIDAVDLDDL